MQELSIPQKLLKITKLKKELSEKETLLQGLDRELDKAKIIKINEEMIELRNAVSDLEKTMPPPIKSTKKSDNKTKEEGSKKNVSLLTVFCWIAVAIVAYLYLGSPSSNTPKFVQKSISDLKAGITSTLGQSVTCSSKQIDNSWVIGCTNGATKWLFEVTSSSSYLGYEAYALNGKAIRISEKQKMQVYQIKRTNNPSLTPKAFDAF